MSRFLVTDLPLPGLRKVQRTLVSDSRGFLTRLFCADELSAAGWRGPVAQINHSFTVRRGAVRGMHYQLAPHTEMKLVSCIRGEVFDVAVDIRPESPTYLHWVGEELSARNCYAMLIPEGFAHGFQALSDEVQLIYCHSSPFVASAQAGLNPLDPRLAVTWPLPISEMSERDRSHSYLPSSLLPVKNNRN
jgi:dTDP-4-dehydrorhamnose 3,5-epimerase